jgi:mono/diheme cytochrome c family protein
MRQGKIVPVDVNPTRPIRRRLGGAALALSLALVMAMTGCRRNPDMAQQPRYQPYEPSEFFADGSSARPIVQGTVSRGERRAGTLLHTGMIDGKLADVFPFPITAADMRRGQERFNIYCSVCHGRLGDGLGMIVQRGFKQPPSFHEPRLREAPAGHFYDVITHGYGGMYSYAARVNSEDRWRIAAYIRALQLSQNAQTADVPADVLQNMRSNPK